MKHIFIAILGSWLGGLAIPFSKILLQDLSPFHLIAISNTGAVLFLLIVKKFHAPKLHLPQRHEVKWLVGGLICGPVLAVPMAVAGLVTVSGSLAGILFNLETFFTFFMAFVIFREALSRWAWAALALILIGGGIVSLEKPAQADWTGIALILGACVFFALQTNLFKKLESEDGYALAMIDFAGAAMVSFLALLFVPAPSLSAGIVTGAVVTGIFSFAFSNVIFFQSVKVIGAGRTAAIFGSTPVLGALSSLVILGEPLTPIIGVSLIIVSIGLALLFWEEKDNNTGISQN